MKTTLFSLLLLACALARADAVDDPWPTVPALPTGCYADDGFADRVWAADETLASAQQQQAEINKALQAQLRDMDPAEIQQRMMDYMMKNPQDAQRAMEAMYGVQASAENTDRILAQADRTIALDGELNALKEEYAAAAAATEASVADPPGAEEGDWCNVSEADYRDWMERYNAAYRSLCAAWWPANGKFHAWMGRWRSHLDEQIVFENEMHETARSTLGIYGIPTGNFRSTVDIEAALEFLHKANGVFDKRQARPLDPGQPGHVAASWYDTC